MRASVAVRGHGSSLASGADDRLAFPRLALAAASAHAALIAAAALLRAAGGAARPTAVLLPALVAVALCAVLWRIRDRSPGAAASEGPAGVDRGRTVLGAGHEAALLALLGAVAAWLALAHVGRWPGMRNDEAIVLQFPANLARHGVLAMRTGERLEPALGIAATGPTVLLPVAAALRATGGDIAVARSVTGLFFLLAAAAFVALARRNGGRGAGVALLVLLLGGAEVTNTARMAIGDYPAAGLLAAGALFWLDALEGGAGARRSLIASGLMLGLMTLTKPSFAVTATGFLAFALHDRVTGRRVRLAHLLVPAAAVLLCNLPWEIYKVTCASGSILGHAAGSGFGLAYTTPSLEGFVAKAREALARPELLLAPAGLLYALGRGGRLARQALLCAFLLAATLGWWLTFYVKLDRYLIVPTLLAALLAAPLIAAAASALADNRDPAARAAALLVVSAGAALPALRMLAAVDRVRSAPAHEMAEAAMARVID